MNILTIIQLIQAVFGAVHAVQEIMPHAPGVEKSKEVVARIEPVTNAIAANADHIQSLIDGAVTVFKMLGAFTQDQKPTMPPAIASLVFPNAVAPIPAPVAAEGP